MLSEDFGSELGILDSDDHHQDEEGSQDAPLLPDTSHESILETEFNGMTRSQAFNLYTSHMLSTWNVRQYEFAAILFTASAFPDTLQAIAIRGIVRDLASICFSSTVGRWVDRSPSRLRTLVTTIVQTRVAVAGASLLWYLIVLPSSPASLTDGIHDSLGLWRNACFAVILMFEVLETLSASGNVFSMERDWVIAAAAPDGQHYDLTSLNASMKSIDLTCKLVAPILISVVVSVTSIKIGVLVVGSMNLVSCVAEIWCAARVWNLNPRLQESKGIHETSTQDTQSLSLLHENPSTILTRAIGALRRYIQDFENYFSSSVWIPSLALALLHLSGLSYDSTLITYLLSVGFSLELITIARAAGSIIEVSSTFTTPLSVRRLGKRNHLGQYHNYLGENDGSSQLEESSDNETGIKIGLMRTGLRGITWQMLWLIPVVSVLFFTYRQHEPDATLDTFLISRLVATQTPLLIPSLILFSSLSISRLGLWTYDLTTQQLTQTLAEPSQRSSFSGVQGSFESLFGLTKHVVTIILYRPEQFKWIALMSFVAVATSTCAYVGWFWRTRGHLWHLEKLKFDCGKIVDRLGFGLAV